ncbi:mucin-5AC-like [Ptychodera flava]|uniref:mucin-5AC-like n=1 Tax=Ptychodera flava TaxID=63121 RepID=UPI00396A5854
MATAIAFECMLRQYRGLWLSSITRKHHVNKILLTFITILISNVSGTFGQNQIHFEYLSEGNEWRVTEAAEIVSQTVNNPCFEWTEWIDDDNGATLDPSSIGEFELLAQLRGPYGFCDQPTDIECRLSDLPHTPYNQTGQVALTCDLQQGFLCFHSQQSGLCFNYAIRLLCQTQCNTSTTPSENMTEFTSTSIKYPQTFPTIPGTDRVTQSATQSSTTFLHMESVKTAEQNLDNLCFEWTEWLDDENGGTLDPSSIGEFELLAQLRGPYGFCDQPMDIECRLSDLPHTPYNQTGQVALTCDLQQGFLCFHSQQSGLCFNYAIRLLCQTQCNTSTTPSENMTEFTSTSIKYPQTFPTIPGNDRVTQSATQSSTTFLRMESVKTAEQNLNNLCFEWTEWLDDENGGTLDPSSIGEFELLAQLRGPYGFCDQPTDIECRLSDLPHTPYNQTGQVALTCDLQQGFLCFHSQQSGLCFNYAIRLLCETQCNTSTTPSENMTEFTSTSIKYPQTFPLFQAMIE